MTLSAMRERNDVEGFMLGVFEAVEGGCLGVDIGVVQDGDESCTA